MPANRPRTTAQARTAAAATGDDDGLAAAWGAERPYEPDWRKIPGAESGHTCSKCGQPMRWTGAHTGLVCAACRVWAVSPGAKARAAEYLAAIDKSAARKSARLADPAAERAAAEALEADRAELLDDLDALAELLDVDGFPRAEPYTPARRAGIKYGAVVERIYMHRAHKAETLDQLDRVADDAMTFADSIGGWLDRIAELRESLDGHPGRVIPGAVEYDDQDDEHDPGDDDEYDPVADRAERQIREALARAAIARRAAAAAQRPGGLRTGGIAPVFAIYCEWCKRDHRYVGATYPPAIARIEAPGMVPAPVDVCADCLAAARQRYGAALHVADQFWAAYDRSVAALGPYQAIEYAKTAAARPRNTRALRWRRGA